MLNHNQLYQVKLKDGSSIQTSHQELFLNKTTLPAQEAFAPIPDLDGLQRLTLQAHPGTTAEELVRWDGMSLKKFNLRTFQKSLSRTTFLSDNPLEVIRVIDTLILASQIAHDENVSFFPEVETLTPQFRFNQLLPPDTYQSYHKAHGFYIALSKTIKIWMSHPLVTASAPLIKRAVDTQIASIGS